jgi:hypothetical protein
MSRLHIRLGTWTITLCMFFVLSGISAMAKPQASTTDDQAATPTTTKNKEEGEGSRRECGWRSGTGYRGHFFHPGQDNHGQEIDEEDY